MLKLCNIIFVIVVLFIENANANINVNTTLNENRVTEVAKIYQAAMVYIFTQQPLINSDTQEKDVLFGQLFINNVKNKYNVMFGQVFTANNDEYINYLLTLMMLVMEDNRTLLLDNEIGFKGFIPAIFAFQLSQKFKQRGYGLNIKFTNFEERVRNKLNAPDHWEKAALIKLNNNNVKSVFNENVLFRGTSASRYMRPVKMKPMCLSCHGIPQNNPTYNSNIKEQIHYKDKTGFIMEGWKLEDLGGAISVVLYPIKENAHEK